MWALMGKETIRVGVELDRESDGVLLRFAKKVERSKRTQARIIVRRVLQTWKDNPENEHLKALGITN